MWAPGSSLEHETCTKRLMFSCDYPEPNFLHTKYSLTFFQGCSKLQGCCQQNAGLTINKPSLALGQSQYRLSLYHVRWNLDRAEHLFQKSFPSMVGLYPILFQLCTEFCDVILLRVVFLKLVILGWS